MERSFSQIKIVKTHLCSKLHVSDIHLARLMRIVIEGPELTSVNFNEILDVFNPLMVNFMTTLGKKRERL